MRRAAGAASLGLAFAVAGATFDTASLYLPAVALLLLSVGAAAWVRLAALGAGDQAHPGSAHGGGGPALPAAARGQGRSAPAAWR